MKINLKAPLKWTKATHEEQQMLRSLQGNILKGHGRAHTCNVFFQLDPTKQMESRRALREIANAHVTNAYSALLDAMAHKEAKARGETHVSPSFVGLHISQTGFTAFGRPIPVASPDSHFKMNMRSPESRLTLADPELKDWQLEFRNQIDGMILVADTTRDLVDAKRDVIVAILGAANATIVHQQEGGEVRNAAGEGIEHFGYVDGRSQPLMLVEDIEDEAKEAGIAQWDAQFGLEAALVQEGSATSLNFGSYFIFRKLEQNVQGFKRREQELATALGFSGAENRELAGAMVVGRFEDGTPVTMFDEAKGLVPPNDFNYTSDAGSRCPFHAHIRKVNPRNPDPAERQRIMPRRGIPFTEVERKVHPNDVAGSGSVSEFDAVAAPKLPTGDVGLLFMAFNSSLANQFVFTQKSWANNADFPRAGTGIDPIIGQHSAAAAAIAPQSWHKEWDDSANATVPFAFADFVEMKGGEYFYTPSLAFLKTL